MIISNKYLFLHQRPLYITGSWPNLLYLYIYDKLSLINNNSFMGGGREIGQTLTFTIGGEGRGAQNWPNKLTLFIYSPQYLRGGRSESDSAKVFI